MFDCRLEANTADLCRSSQHANASSNGGYSYNQQVPAQMQQDNTYVPMDSSFDGVDHC